MNVEWNEILLLLRGDEKTGSLASKLLCEISTKNHQSKEQKQSSGPDIDSSKINDYLKCNITYDKCLPDIFHALCCTQRDYLSSTNWNTRRNSAYALQCLTSTHSHQIIHQLQTFNKSDGILLTIADLDVDAILSRGYESLLSGSTSSSNAQNVDYLTDELYQKIWLSRQRKQLFKRLGIGINDTDIRSAYIHDDTVDIIDSTDITTVVVEPDETSMDIKIMNNTNYDDITSEFWFIRILRLLTVGILDPIWEVRHGYCIGLSKIVLGLATYLNIADLNHMTNDPQSTATSCDDESNPLHSASYILPSYILEDILCSCMCTLLLDRFIDIDAEGTNIISPVKEMAGQLIAISSSNMDNTSNIRIYDILCHMCRNSEWSVQFGGVIALKYWILSKYAISHPEVVVDVIRNLSSCLENGIDDVKVASVQLLGSIAKMLETNKLCVSLSDIQTNQLIQLSWDISLMLSKYAAILGSHIVLSALHSITIVNIIQLHHQSIKENTAVFINIISCIVDCLIKSLVYHISNIGVCLKLNELELYIINHIATLKEVIKLISALTISSDLLQGYDNIRTRFREYGFVITVIIARFRSVDDGSDLPIMSITDTQPLNRIYNFSSCLSSLGFCIMELMSFLQSNNELKLVVETVITDMFDAAFITNPKKHDERLTEIFHSQAINQVCSSKHVDLVTNLGLCLSSYILVGMILGAKTHTDSGSDKMSYATMTLRQLATETISQINASVSNGSLPTAVAEQVTKKPRFVLNGVSMIHSSSSICKTQNHSLSSKSIHGMICLLTCIRFTIHDTMNKSTFPNIPEKFTDQFTRFLQQLASSSSFHAKISLCVSPPDGHDDISLVLASVLMDDFLSHPDDHREYITAIVDTLSTSDTFIIIVQVVLSRLCNMNDQIASNITSHLISLASCNKAVIRLEDFIQIIAIIITPLSCNVITNLINQGNSLHLILISSFLRLPSNNHSTDLLQMISHIFRTLSSKMLAVATQQCLWSSTINYLRQQLSGSLDSIEHSRTIHQLINVMIIHIDTNIVMIHYKQWMSFAMSGLTHYDAIIRQTCADSFRYLVPLTPLYHSNHLYNATEEHDDSSSPWTMLFHFILLRTTPPSLLNNEADQHILTSLSSHAVPSVQLSSLPLDLRKYQWDGISYLTYLRRCGLGALLADDMGIGKTIQALTTLAIICIEKSLSTSPFLVICPASLTLHWKLEIAKFFQPVLLRGMIIASLNDLESNNISSYGSGDVVIISYDMVRRAHSSSRSQLHNIVWEGIILDEAHIIKNPATATATSIYALKSNTRIALTGTPIQNHVQELWSIMHFLIPDFLGNYHEFRKQYVIPINKSILHRNRIQASLPSTSIDNASAANTPSLFSHMALGVTAEGLQVLNALHKQVLPFILRRTKESVLKELPEKTIVDIYCSLTSIQQQLYSTFKSSLQIHDDVMEERLIQSLTNQPDINNSSSWNSSIHPFQALKYLQLLCVHPSLVIGSQHRQYKQRLLKDDACSGKMMQLCRLLLDANIVLDEECANTQIMCHDNDNDASSGVHDHDDMDSDELDSENDNEFKPSSNQKRVSYDDGQPSKLQTHKRSIRQDIIYHDKPSSHTVAQPSVIHSDKIPETISNHMTASHKCLIFAHHQATLDIIESLVMKRHFPSVLYARLDGNIPPSKRAAIAHDFNQSPSPRSSDYCPSTNYDIDSDATPILPSAAYQPYHGKQHPTSEMDKQSIRILLLTTRACGLGLNLTAADTVIFIEHDWNPFVDLQAMDRVHRIGQKKPVTIYRILAESTVEARVVSLQDIKKVIAHEIVKDSDASTSSRESSACNGSNALGDQLWRSFITAKNNQDDKSAMEQHSIDNDKEYENLNIDNFLSTIGQLG